METVLSLDAELASCFPHFTLQSDQGKANERYKYLYLNSFTVSQVTALNITHVVTR
jgi:hypothetical protein